MEPRENKQTERAAPAPGLVKERCQPLFLFLFHLPWYQIGCYSKNLVPWNECALPSEKAKLTKSSQWSSLFLYSLFVICTNGNRQMIDLTIFEAWSYFFSGCENVGSISESDQLHTYPSPDPTLTLTCYFLIVVELGGRGVGLEFLRY